MSERRTSLSDYDAMSAGAAARVIGTYSTSFSLATRLLDPRTRTDIRNLYAVVRIADEIVDGTATDAGLRAGAVREELDTFEREVRRAVDTGFSTNPVLHAFAGTARRTHIDPDHLTAFFTSMRRDLSDSTVYDEAGLDSYIYGSAEVIGLMCLAVFTSGRALPDTELERCSAGARRLGAAFQKINFLRDLHEDTELGRSYLGGRGTLTDRRRDEIIADVRTDLDAALETVGPLPVRARAGVLAALLLYRELTDRLAATPAAEITRRRVSVPSRVKAGIPARALLMAARMRP
ncbi:phytoene/squalene synthase family protein [Corynebacterium sp. CCM 9187]|uniref:Phytoene/squalene synthase family protein n=2 Tax=Corynebacterium pygosceleis TaxID=2800406 RepID=A0A9Q4GHL9_9CORY|nr:phytoene/squalene synthase family protein [Corynebacterium pygosceleis]MCK7636518.1 phytoene/squalene synthase family protein [Corynebacterium pygosceleis]MCK7675092.1 phytoene/squalene synthase family protein [Corynebacterium pygosceleis]MCX7444246.1 phytoene/squalene synthase family protein [Corynebacterium pygosceleis]MCX7467271.1 phytoene/squalene synthase family protein [Corynebacterium pygosceleis]